MQGVILSRQLGALLLAGGVGMTLMSCALPRAEINTERDMTAVARTNTTLWSMASVLELYKLSGWRILDVRRVWANERWPNGDSGMRHNAFTDLARFKGRWYCVFRVGEDHGVSGPKGGLRVIRSRDGWTWTSVFFYQPRDSSVDVRDSKLVVTHDGRIAIFGYESYRCEPARSEFAKYGSGRSLTWLSSDGEHWSGPNFSKGGEDTWIWGGAWHRDVGYGVAYSGKHAGGALYRTRNGMEWELVATNIFPKDAGGHYQGNEASIFFDPDDSAWMYVRDAACVDGKTHNLGFSRPPYHEWDWTRTTYINLGGPKMMRLSDGRIVAAGRIWGRPGGPGYGDSRTCLFELDLQNNAFHEIADLPSQGDNGYPGMVEKDGELWISYYSTHEDPNREGRRAHLQRACIYLARVKIGGPRYKYPSTDRYAMNPVPPYQREPELATTKKALPSRLPANQFEQVFYVDLSALVNRSFADEVADDGTGGWSDQGPNCDMRNVKTGTRTFGGVPFQILPGRSCVVLKSIYRKQGNLPGQVNIPLGRKVDMLFFLHSAAYFEGAFEYVLHYADGKDVTITMDSRNFADWSGPPIARFPEEQGTFTTVAETVPSPMFGKGSLYRTEWSAPADRRAVELESIEFRHDGKCIPILVAITGVLKR